MPKRTRVFYAYPNDPPHIGETVSATIDRLRAQGHLENYNLHFTPWKDSPITGQPISSILRRIDQYQIFACDLTYPNPNVAFELGYAIGRFTRVFATLNTTVEAAGRDYTRIYSSLLNMGYTQYTNHEDLADSFLSEKPYDSLQHTLLDRRFQRQLPRPEYPTLLYMKPPHKSDSVICAEEKLRRSIFKDSLILDDPSEYSSQPLEWYAEKMLTADAVLIHLLSTDHADHGVHNLKASLLAGLAHGLGRRTSMLAHAPYKPPVDYQQWLRVHDTAGSCVEMLTGWVDQLSAQLTHRRARRDQHLTQTTRTMDLRSLFLGDPVAEHEQHQLYEYFVETSAYYNTRDNPLTILVGRRGTGKTAILYAIANDWLHTKDSCVTIVKPVGYETHGLIRILEEVRQHSERGFLIESLWKYLIYSEVARTVSAEIRDRPTHIERTAQETSFVEYCDSHSHVVDPPFSQRIDNAVSALKDVGVISDASQQQAKISEALHDTFINGLRRQLGIALQNARGLVILIDGLDEPWGLGEHIEHLAELIGGLLTMAQTVNNDFRRSSSRVRPVNTKIAILLRSDIFAFIQHLIPEQDKLPIVRVTWNDHQLLLRVLNERMLHGAPSGRTAIEIWDRLFPDNVVGVSAEKFILRTVLPRPRDLIHLVKAAVNNAIDGAHETIQPEHLLAARDQYSQYAFDSILKEDDPTKGNLENVLYEFLGAGSVVGKADIEERMRKARVGDSDMEFYLDLLCDINFLGIETTDGFRYARDEEHRRISRSLAKVLSSRGGCDERFQINPAFYQVLQIE